MNIAWSRLTVVICALLSGFAFAQAGTVESIQPFRQEQVAATADGAELQLVNLNLHVNSLYLLRIRLSGRPQVKAVNLQNPGAPARQLRLNAKNPYQMDLVQSGRVVASCPDFIAEVLSPRAASLSYASVCGGQLYVRNKANGYQPNMERAVQMLRENLGGFGESIINTAKETVFEDKYREQASVVKGVAADKRVVSGKVLKTAALNEKFIGHAVNNHKLGVRLPPGYSSSAINVGEWYPAAKIPNVFVSVITPGMVSPEILKSHPKRVNPLQENEAGALVYLVAFDMKAHSLGWAHGTNQPGVGWSDRLSPEKIQSFGGGLGPDGVNSFGDLVNPGHVPPADLPRTVATISGGFQLKHSHFQWGPYSTVNKSTHFGFIEDGVVMMKPSPGLSTVYVRLDGSFNMKTWTEADNAELPKIRYLRQNGLPLIEPDETGAGIPGPFVSNRGQGNWSGSAEGNNFTPRGAACLIEDKDEQYFVYAYFSAATPNAMARVFQAYGCKQAIHLDMNSPGQSYLSLVAIQGNAIEVEPLTTDMAEVNPRKNLPRYLASPDFRDFFWIVKK